MEDGPIFDIEAHIDEEAKLAKTRVAEELRHKMEKEDRIEDVELSVCIPPRVTGSKARLRVVDMYNDMLTEIGDELGVRHTLDEKALNDGEIDVPVHFSNKQVSDDTDKGKHESTPSPVVITTVGE